MHKLYGPAPLARTTYTGKVDFVSPYHAFIIVEGLEKDILVASNHLQGAMHGDVVKVSVFSEKKKGRQEGKVVDVVSRTHTKVVGCVVQRGGDKVVMPDHKRLHHPIKLVKQSAYNDVAVHDKVVVHITHYPTEKIWAQGKITKILGPRGSHQAELNAILEEYDLDENFPLAVQKAADALPDKLSKKEVVQRRDFTKTPTCTVDPVDAKDFDDALSVKKLANGDYEVGIHIADVSCYVRKDGVIDQEALRRGTSVYLVGTCVSMLPQRLANDLCSLKPNVVRPAFSVVVTLNQEAKVQSLWIGESVIYSQRRFSYEQAQEVIEKGKGDFAQELGWLHQLAKKLRKQRLQSGAIDFDTTDLDIRLDGLGQPVQILPKIASDANKLIEEFMLLANKLVAEKIYKKKQGSKHATFIYRVHDRPEAGKLEDFVASLKQLGYSFNIGAKSLGREFNRVLKTVQDTPHKNIVQTLAIRTMAQALYTTEPKSHFGLNFAYYTHFTSPIRRYPDLVVHRLTKDYLRNKPSPDKALYEQITAHTSSRERLAIDAERSSISGKQVLYMKKLEGKTYQGVISGITSWGIYVELIENKCEGMVKVYELKDDYYELGNRNASLIGKKTKKMYTLGDLVWVKIKYCDVERKTTDLIFV